MEAKVIKTHSNGQQVVVTVGFFDAQDVEVGQKVYYLDPSLDLDSLKPKIKDDLKEYEAAHEKALELSDLKERGEDKIDLEGVKGQKQLNTEAEAAKKKAVENPPA